MELSYTYWQEPDGWLLGYFNAWPEHITQGKTVEELEFMLKDIYELMELGEEAQQKSPVLMQGELALA
ncbi:MAG: type II toxin-antitoxin system HicB family antitoxin [Spirochaetaceae bacterium]|jgi:predicted RNase H-like HicB family nuclease|nr:type II toxin-antitoxin system HicB family antitoxin [Spirochaetaceae bacterium]